MKIVIFNSPQRSIELARLLNELKGLDVSVINDPETFGKDKFWMRMKRAFELCLGSEHNEFVIMPDDVYNVDLDRIRKYHKEHRVHRYAINLINDGRWRCWKGRPRQQLHTTELLHVDFVDCGIITNRRTLGLIQIDPVPASWFDRPNKSSGVGFQMTTKFRQQSVLMYTPHKSLVYHGDHESVMHKEERERNKLISK
jgi:hypothetical protein